MELKTERSKTVRATGVVAALGTVVLVVGAAHADDGLLLRCKHTAGAVETYAVKGTLRGELKPPKGEARPSAAEVEMVVTVRTTAVDGQGAASQQTTIDRLAVTSETMGGKTEMVVEGGKATIASDGRSRELPLGVPGMEGFGQPLQAKVDARGRTLEADDAGRRTLGGIDPYIIRQTTILPERAVASGDTWSQAVSLPVAVLGLRIVVPMEYDYKLEGLDQYKGKAVARITFTAGGQVRGADIKRPFEVMTQTLSGYDLFDYAAGRSVFSRLHMEQTINGLGAAGRPSASVTMAGDFDAEPK